MSAILKRMSLGRGGQATLSAGQMAFKEKLSPEAIAYFNDVASKPFSQQAVAFLNAYWDEVGDQADFIFNVAWPTMKYADMHTKGVNYVHLYDEGVELDFNVGLYFYEHLCKRVLDEPSGAKWRNDSKYAMSMPEMLTAIVRKKEIRDKVDVNFDGKISFLEYLLYQYRDVANPAEFTRRGMDTKEHPKVRAARLALEEVNAQIRAYETERQRLLEASKQPGVKGLTAKHTLSMLLSSPIAEGLQVALIKAEAAVRAATKIARAEAAADYEASGGASAGALWWMNADLAEKKRLYGRQSS